MEIVLEVERPNGVRSWHGLHGGTVTLGRALTNDVILDDPYVDAHHMRLGVGEGDAVIVEDLGSVNGVTVQKLRITSPAVLNVGSEIHIGRTIVRVRRRDEPVPAAVRQGEPVPLVPANHLIHWHHPSVSQLLVIATASMGVWAAYGWLGSAEKSTASDAIGLALLVLVGCASWAAIWALASRLMGRLARYAGHFAIALATGMVAVPIFALDSWSNFLFPDAKLVQGVNGVALAIFVIVVVATHLSLVSRAEPRRRWTVAAVSVVGLFLLAAGISSLAEEEFNPTPEHPVVLKPLAERWIPTTDLDGVGAQVKEVQEEVVEELRVAADTLVR